MTAAMPEGPARRVLIGTVLALLATGVVGAALVGGGSGTASRSGTSVPGAGAGAGTSAAAQPSSAVQPTTATTSAPAAAPAPAAEGPFWAVVLGSFPDTAAGADAANAALPAARAADPQASVIHTDGYSSLRHGLVAVVGAHLGSRAEAVAEAGRLQQQGFPDANARCVTAGPACS